MNIRAILFDLDGTLLDQMDGFLPHYFQGLADLGALLQSWRLT